MNDTASVKDIDEVDGVEESEDGGNDPGRRLVRLLVGGRMRRNSRLRRLLLAHLLKERMEASEEDEGEDIDDESDEGSERAHKLVRLLVVGRMRRHVQLRRMLLAHLLKERMEASEEDGDEEIDDDSDEGSERAHKLVRLLVVGRLRRHTQLRRLLLAHLLKERMEASEEDEDEGIDDEGNGDGSERARKLARLLVVGRMHRHAQLRRSLAAHLAHQHA
jgi:predicted transcriptional regulator